MRALLLLLPWLLLAACATAEPKPEGPPPAHPAARSSIDAVLSHRSELELTDEQVGKLQALDDERERKASELRAELQAARNDAREKHQTSRGGPASGTGAPGGMGGPGMGAGGMGSRGMGGGRGGGMRGPAMGPAGPPGPDAQGVWQRLDELDTQTFMATENVFKDAAQRERAAIIATKYREELFNYREAMKRRKLEAE